MLSCEVISDLMLVYTSGEASAETRRLVEEHLARCSACRQAFGQDRPPEAALADLAPAEGPAGASRFVARTRRLVFTVSTAALLLFACMLAAVERVIMEGIAGMRLAGLPGSDAVWLAVAAGAAALYIALLVRRRRGRAGVRRGDLAFALAAAVPLSVTAAATYYLVGSGPVAFALAALLLLLVALAFTYVSLPRLAYMTLATVLALALVSGVLLVHSTAGVLSLGDLALDSAASLGHPAEGVALPDAVRVDLRSFGLDWQGAKEVTRVGDVQIASPAQAVQGTYVGGGHEALVTVLQFPSPTEAERFFVAWSDAVDGGIQLMSMNLQSSLAGGRITRSYSVYARCAYSAWQTQSWATIIEVPGPIAEAGPLAREVKAAVAASYRAGRER